MSLSFAVMIIVTMTATLPFGVIPRSLETRWDARSCQIGVYFGLSGPEPYGDQRGAFLDNSRSGGEPAVNVRQFAFLVLVVGAVGGLAVLGWRLIQNEQVDIRHSGSQAAVDCENPPSEASCSRYQMSQSDKKDVAPGATTSGQGPAICRRRARGEPHGLVEAT